MTAARAGPARLSIRATATPAIVTFLMGRNILTPLLRLRFAPPTLLLFPECSTLPGVCTPTPRRANMLCSDRSTDNRRGRHLPERLARYRPPGSSVRPNRHAQAVSAAGSGRTQEVPNREGPSWPAPVPETAGFGSHR